MSTTLLVLPESGLRNELSNILQQHGMNTLVASSIADGLQTIITLAPPVVVVDLTEESEEAFTIFVEWLKGTDFPLTKLLLLATKRQRVELAALRSGEKKDSFIIRMKPVTDTDLLTDLKKLHEQVEKAKREESETLADYSPRLPYNLQAGFNRLINQLTTMIEGEDPVSQENLEGLLEEVRKLRQDTRSFSIIQQLHGIGPKSRPGRALNRRTVPDAGSVITGIVQRLATKADRFEDVTVSADEEVLRLWEQNFISMLEELVGNALRHSPKGTPIRITGTSEERAYRLEISNTAKIPLPDLPGMITEAASYYRGLRRRKATDAGLFSVRRMVEIHNGKVNIAQTSAALPVVVEMTLRKARNYQRSLRTRQ